MRRLPRLRSAAPAAFTSLSTPSGTLRAAPACTLSAATNTTASRKPAILPSQRYLSTSTPFRAAQPPTSQPEANNTPINPDSLPEETDLESDYAHDSYEALDPSDIPTPLIYPQPHLSSAPSPSEVTDPSYKPAETADNLEEVGGLAGWWDEPSHWGTSALDGSAQGVAGYVRSVTGRFGPPAGVVEDPALLEALARRAVVEVLALGGKRKAVLDRLFEVTEEEGDGMRIGAALRARLREVDGEGDKAAEVVRADGGRVRAAIARALKKTVADVEVEEGQEGEAGVVVEDVEAKEPVVAEDAAPKPARYLTPEMAAELIQSWGHKWKKAELRDPVVKFYIAKRIQQLTGRRIPDGKLLAITTIDSLIKELVMPPKPLKLAELVETKGAFKGLPNVRVFPRRVTPIDKEQMVGRWKIIVKELEKRDLPLTGTGDHGAPVEKKWIEGRA